MKRIRISPFIVATGLVVAGWGASGFPGVRTAASKEKPREAPAFPSAEARDWIGTPQNWDTLKGRVVLLDVWTFG